MKGNSWKSVRVLLMLMTASCETAPAGWLGVTWQMPANLAAERLAMDCEGMWRRAGIAGFDECIAGERKIDNLDIAHIVLIRQGGRLAAIQAILEHCDLRSLRQRLAREFSRDPEYIDYVIWDDGAQVRLRERDYGRCFVVVTNASYGRAYRAAAASRDFPNLWH